MNIGPQLMPLPFIQQQQQQKLIVTTRLKQQLDLLHMSQQEVHDIISEALCSNPLLELDPSPPPEEDTFCSMSLDDTALGIEHPDFHEEMLEPSISQQVSFTDFDTPIQASRYDRSNNSTDLLSTVTMEDTLFDYLLFQLSSLNLTNEQREICECIIYSLDERGYFIEPIKLFCQQLNFDELLTQQMLHVVHTLEPAGVGARNLKECLILQLAANQTLNEFTTRIVNECLNLLAENNISAIAKHLGLPVERANKHCDTVRSLSPIPTHGYHTGEHTLYIVPDAVITSTQNGFTVQMNNNVIPRLTLNEDYCRMMKEVADPHVLKYLRKNRSSAENLIFDINMRQSTLSRVIQSIISLQTEFFRDGKTLLPMTISNVADLIGVHISTVSRAIHDKYIVCSAGTVNLRSLFTGGYQKQDDGQGVSATVLKRKLTDLISKEDPASPLTDNALLLRFEKMGIHISRRTIAKYRDDLGILSSAKRRKFFH